MAQLIGRGPAAAAVGRAVDDARAGRGGLVLIAGEPGIGKTALAASVAETSGAAVAWGVCAAGSGVPDFWPWPAVLRGLGADPMPAGGDWFEVATTVVGALRAAGFAVVVLDDLQWAGAGAVRVLEFAARQLAREPVLLIGAYRDVEVDAGHPLAGVRDGAEVVTLAGLDTDGVALLLAATGAGPVTDAQAADVHRRSGGNPFFVQQIGRLLAAEPAAVPVAVHEAIARRLARLPAPTAALLDIASAAGGEVDAALLATAAGIPYADAEARLAPAVAARVLRATDRIGGYRFAHDLYWESRYAALDPDTRARAHHAFGAALLARDAAGGPRALGDVAHHLARAVPAARPDEVLPHVRAAAEDAAGRRAYEESARHWRAAVRLAELDGHVPVEMRLDLADALLRAGEPAAARDAYLAAVDRAGGDATVVARAAYGVHLVGVESGAPRDDLVALLTRADADPAGGPAGARVRAALARELADGPDRDEERASALAASAVALARDVGDPATLAACLFAQHDVEWAPGTAAARLPLIDRLIAAADAGGDAGLAAEAVQLRFAALVELADPLAGAALADLEERAAASGQPRPLYLARSRRAAYALLTGPLDAAGPLVGSAHELGLAIGQPDATGVYVTQHTVGLIARGGPSAAGAAMRAAGRPFMPAELRTHQRMFEHVAAGEIDAAAALLRAVDRAGEDSLFRWRALARIALEIDIADAVGAGDLCPPRYRRLRPYAGQMLLIGGAVAVLPPVDHYLGVAARRAGDPATARRHFADAAALADRLGARGYAAQSRIEAAMLDGDRSRLAAEAEVADELGYEAARDRALAHRVAPPAEFRRAGDVWTLTYAGVTARMPDSKGLRDIAALLAAPGREISARELAGDPTPDTGADEVLDARARAEYKARLADLDAEIDEAAADHDDGRRDRAAAEREALVAALAEAYGLGGRPRRLRDPGERARTAVTARIRDTLHRLDRVHPALAGHLRAAVSTGRSCAYRPAEPVRWAL